MNVNPGYETLASVLQRALDQAQNGKGAERHANASPFHEQPMQLICRTLNSNDFAIGQAIKKATESKGLPAGRDVAELLGAINYLAGAVIYLETVGHEKQVPVESAPKAVPTFDWQKSLTSRVDTPDAFEFAPEWVKWKAQDKLGNWWWFEHLPLPNGTGYSVTGGKAVLVPAFRDVTTVESEEQEVEEHIDWRNTLTSRADNPEAFTNAPEWAQFKAMDGDGVWYWYESKPRGGGTVFYPRGGIWTQVEINPVENLINKI